MAPPDARDRRRARRRPSSRRRAKPPRHAAASGGDHQARKLSFFLPENNLQLDFELFLNSSIVKNKTL
eukprot:6200333-Pleurochrysis_carterae.AAC.1